MEPNEFDVFPCQLYISLKCVGVYRPSASESPGVRPPCPGDSDGLESCLSCCRTGCVIKSKGMQDDTDSNRGGTSLSSSLSPFSIALITGVMLLADHYGSLLYYSVNNFLTQELNITCTHTHKLFISSLWTCRPPPPPLTQLNLLKKENDKGLGPDSFDMSWHHTVMEEINSPCVLLTVSRSEDTREDIPQ